MTENKDNSRQLEELLKQVELKYKAIFDSSSDAIMVLAPDGKFTSGNIAAVKMFGCSDEKEFISKSPAELSPEYQPDGSNSVQKSKQMIEAALEKGSHYFEWVHKRCDGVEFYATVLLTALNLEGRWFVQATVRDISEERKLKEARERLAAIVDSSEDAIIGKTLEGIITSWNKAAEKIYGYSAQEMIGRSISILIPEDKTSELREIYKGIAEGRGVKHLEATRRRKDGREITVALTISPIKDASGKIIGASTIARDITENKLMEKELKKKIRDLEVFNKVAIERELKIIELKKKIKKIEANTGEPI